LGQLATTSATPGVVEVLMCQVHVATPDADATLEPRPDAPEMRPLGSVTCNEHEAFAVVCTDTVG
jgi:hypothetical protein